MKRPNNSPGILVLLFSSLVIVSACNSGSGGSHSDGDDSNQNASGSGGDTLPSLGGLTGVPANDNWVYFTSNATNNSGLFAFNPKMPEKGAELVDEDVYLLANPYVFHPIASADINGNELSNYRADYIFYRRMEEMTFSGTSTTLPMPRGFRRAATEQSLQPATPLAVSSEDNSNSVNYFFQFDLSQPLNTAIAYRADSQWRQIRLGDTKDQAPLTFDENHNPMVPLGNGSPNGWLAINESNNNELIKLGMDLNSQGPVLNGSDAVDQLEYINIMSHLGLDSQLIALTFEDPDTSDEQMPLPELWLYTDGNPGTIKPLLNNDGDKLTFSSSLFGQGASLPSANKMVVKGETLYFAFHEQSDFSFLGAYNPMLYRVDKNGWSREIDYLAKTDDDSIPVLASPFLIDAGDHLIWLVDGDLASIDLADYSETPLYEGSIDTPVVDSSNGWFFYNDERDIDSAVAARTDGSKTVRLHKAQWIGASSMKTGNVALRQAKAEISEVFLLREDGTLGAVRADQPDAGMVTLGQLSPIPEAVQLFGMRSGSHQLMQVGYEDDSYEVIYVNTEQADSLRYLMTSPSSADGAGTQTRPVYSK